VTIGKRHALLWGPFFIFILAFILHVKQIFIMFAALGCLAPVSYALGRRKLADISVSRHGKSVMTAGERGTVTITVRNEGRLRQFFLGVTDELPDGLESPEGGQVLVADLTPESEHRLSYSLNARRRGVYQVGPSRLETFDYLGLYRFTRRADEPAELLVYPRPIPIPHLWPRAVGGRTPHKAARRVVGPSTEFYSLRDYYPGDDLRRVAWKSSAKRGKLTVIETEQIESMECVLLVDLSSSAHAGEGDKSTIEYAATLAASLASEALDRACNVGLIAQGAEDHSVVVSSNPRQRILLLEALARMGPDADIGLPRALAEHEAALPPGCGIAVISPALGAEALAIAARLHARRHPVTWFALAPHTFDAAARRLRADYENTVARLAAQGARVIQIQGDLPLETSLWRRGSRGGRA